ncbi:Procollagen C-endopeptidase enhancer 1-like [Homarus americanus]|uniref:Procollagen C-endopeptidase enhancer 1-like n=1 Tax=Homarus americanus TaxID=6706 RepID=A0A8J5JUQ6_HOMAM|nr:Procollagen C-endopeptidase enhancer 1-like [Homarus americanus]
MKTFTAAAAAAAAALVWAALATVKLTEAGPVNALLGDLCRRMDGRKFYLEAETHALITATNITLPAFPRIATRNVVAKPGYRRHLLTRHRREGPQQIGLPEPRYRRNLTTSSLTHLRENTFLAPHDPPQPLPLPQASPPALQPPPPARQPLPPARQPPPRARHPPLTAAANSPSAQSPEMMLDEPQEQEMQGNKYHITGKANATRGYIKSPFFPELYPKEHWMEYELWAEETDARIKINFQDFQLSPWSFIEVQDTNKSRVAVFNGNVFRPPILVSSGRQITIRFSGNGETARGFNLQYSFIDANCGGFVTNFGGTITMMNMAKEDSNFTMYDCVWIVQPPQNYAFKSHLSIRVVQFDDMGCYTLTDLMCHNHRCIPKMLRCDGFDHCGDNSDEPTTCYMGPGNKSLTPEDAAWWYQHTPNYYFPQSSLSDGVEIFDASADDPPLYEPPPDYEEVIKVILSGNNLKLVRRPGGVTAWVPDKLANEVGESRANGERPLRTRHASLDLEQGMEVVLWNPNVFSATRERTTTGTEAESRNTLSAQVPLGHVRRSSLPVTPLPEIIQAHVQGHSVSIAPETITEAPEGVESPRPSVRPVHTLTSPQLSVRSFTYDTSAVSTPGTSTPQNLRVAVHARKSKRLTKRGGKRKKKTSAARKPERQGSKEDDSAPPSYEMAMQQASQGEPVSPRPVEGPSTSNAASQVNESTQTSSDSALAQDMSPTDRLRAAREMFQRMSRGEGPEEEPRKTSVVVRPAAKRPAAPANRTKHNRMSSSGGTINRGTVKARKAMLLKAQKLRPDCTCNGACSCAHFKPENSKDENLHMGGVKSKVHYYLAIEESTKKRDADTSVGTPTVTVDPNNKDNHKLPEDSPVSSATLKKRKLVRNQSAPSLGHIVQRDLDSFFSQNDSATMSSVEDLECPLISPVPDSPKPIIVATQTAPDTTQSPEEEIIPSIRNRVYMYNGLSQTPTSPRLGSRHSTPSPARSPVTPLREHVPGVLRSDSVESSGGGLPGLVCMKNAVVDANIKPGLVKEATAKFITTFNKEFRPKLHLQESDDWNEGSDSSLPSINIPYLNLKNEDANSPDISDTEKVSVPPLKQEEAESIELWDSRSQGIPEWPSEVDSEDLPSPASGAVPKRPLVVTVKKSADSSLIKRRGKTIVIKADDRVRVRTTQVKNKLRLDLTDKFTPTNGTEVKDDGPKPRRRETKSPSHRMRLASEEDLVVMNLNTSATTTPMMSEDDSPPPSPQSNRTEQSTGQQNTGVQCLDETLNETLDTDSGADEIEDEERSPFIENQSNSCQAIAGCSSQTKRSMTPEEKPKKKIPIPSPRGSKVASAAITMVDKEQNSTRPQTVGSHEGSPAAAGGVGEKPTSPSLALPQVSSESYSPGRSSGEVTSPRYTSQHPPTLSPQMMRSGIVTIQTGHNLKWDYI